jgi:hypothetical protein
MGIPGCVMRRIFLEWGLILSLGMLLVVVTVWVVSLCGGREQNRLEIPTTRVLGDRFYVVVGRSTVQLFSTLATDRSGNIVPRIVDVRTNLERHRRFGRFRIPGFEWDYCQFARDGHVVWSLRLSLLYPLLVSLVCAVFFRLRLKRLRNYARRAEE